MHVKTPQESPVRMNEGVPPERLYNSREARKLLGDISEGKFRQLTKTGELPAVKQGTYVYVTKSAIDGYIAALPSAQEPAAR